MAIGPSRNRADPRRIRGFSAAGAKAGARNRAESRRRATVEKLSPSGMKVSGVAVRTASTVVKLGILAHGFLRRSKRLEHVAPIHRSPDSLAIERRTASAADPRAESSEPHSLSGEPHRLSGRPHRSSGRPHRSSGEPHRLSGGPQRLSEQPKEASGSVKPKSELVRAIRAADRSTVEDAHRPAMPVADALTQMVEGAGFGAGEEVMDTYMDLVSRVRHQGTVYSASALAIGQLVEMADRSRQPVRPSRQLPPATGIRSLLATRALRRLTPPARPSATSPGRPRSCRPAPCPRTAPAGTVDR
jgi:hypothetical protein